MLIEGIFEKYQGAHINLYGSAADATFTDEIAMFFNRSTISNLTGRTTILELVAHMQGDDLIISIDSGGMHLANMFGCPLICIYGITNPIATGPIFDAHKMIVMPDSCPARGGFPTEDVDSKDVLKAVKLMLR
jgi:heptosyltransferase-2